MEPLRPIRQSAVSLTSALQIRARKSRPIAGCEGRPASDLPCSLRTVGLRVSKLESDEQVRYHSHLVRCSFKRHSCYVSHVLVAEHGDRLAERRTRIPPPRDRIRIGMRTMRRTCTMRKLMRRREAGLLPRGTKHHHSPDADITDIRSSRRTVKDICR